MKKTNMVLILVLLGAIGFTTNVQAQSCSELIWTDEFLSTNPNIHEVCLEVIEKNSVSVVRLHARVVRQSVNSTIVQWQRPDGSWSPSERVFPEYGATAEIDGKSVKITDLAPRQEVNVYIVSEHWSVEEVAVPVAAPAPAPAPAPMPEPEPEPEPVMLPTTATQVPLFALLGGLFVLLGGAVGFARTRL